MPKDTTSIKLIMDRLEAIEQKQDKTHVALFGDELASPPCQGAIGKIISRQDKTNGKVKLVFWIASTAMGLFTIVLGLVVAHMSGK